MVTAADVAAWGKFTAPAEESADLALLERVVSAVTEVIERDYVVAEPLTTAQEQAVLIQSSRLWKRRDTPEGIAAFADIQAVRIDSLDRDVQMLLRLKTGGFA